MSKRWLLAGFVLVGGLTLQGAWGLSVERARERITPEAAQAIRVGMPREEVEAMLGSPSGDCTFDRATGQRIHRWIGRSTVITVALDREGNVAWQLAIPVHPSQATILEKLSAWAYGREPEPVPEGCPEDCLGCDW